MVKINSSSRIFGEIFSVYVKNAFYDELPIILCIGSEKATGDALAPLVGTLLIESNIPTFVYGTLENTVNAKNLSEVYEFIKHNHKGKKILCIDACVGNEEDIGFVKFSSGGLFPGSAVDKNCGNFGDYSILGIVDRFLSDPFKVFTCRLSVVYDLAKKISVCLSESFVELNVKQNIKIKNFVELEKLNKQKSFEKDRIENVNIKKIG